MAGSKAVVDSKAIRVYLERYAEPEARLSLQTSREYDRVVVVPAHDEPVELLQGFAEASRSEALLILVVNSAIDCATDAVARTHTLLSSVRARATFRRVVHQSPPIEELEVESLRVLLIDRTSQGYQLPKRQGVGMARRIGCDVALSLIHRGAISVPCIASTDADVTLPNNYFDSLRELDPSDAAALFPFVHTAAPTAPLHGASTNAAQSQLLQATLLFECSLRYLTLGLAHAGSPYAFHTIGSTFALSARAYAEARGFPKRLAGEDFHLLNKLAKLGPLLRLSGSPILIHARTSHRTPFGTGNSVSRLLEELPRQGAISDLHSASLPLFHPVVFEALRVWFSLLRSLAKAPDRDVTQWFAKAPTSSMAGLFSELLPDLHTNLQRVMRQHKDPKQRLVHLFCWFDALKIMQLTRKLSLLVEPLGFRSTLATAPFIEAIPEGASLEVTREKLLEMEQRLPARIGPTL